MPDYRTMYGIMMRASEKAIRILIEAQQRCEELAIAEEPNLVILPLSDTEKDITEGP